jgi:hypothetical protein
MLQRQIPTAVQVPAAAPFPVRSAPPRTGAGGPACEEERVRSIEVRYGIHSGAFPVAGMTVAESRRTLAGLLNIDPEAIAVLNGRPVRDEETRVITEAEQILSFVKRSSIRGASGRGEVER